MRNRSSGFPDETAIAILANNMDTPTGLPALASLPSAFAAACRNAATDAELFERCREALVHRFGSERIWFKVTSPGALIPVLPAPEWLGGAVEVIRLASG